jgi:tetratricopeptide (TPR) repeat protein
MNSRSFPSVGFLFLTILAGCHSPSDSSATNAPYDDLGATHRAIATASPAAQRAFDQGLILMWGFNHDEAIAAFHEAARLDPAAVMPWWGIALANGPHINNPQLDPDHARAAWEALGEARAREKSATALERELIEAVGARYSSDFGAARPALDQAYAQAMRGVWLAHQDDADVGTWCAEALMDLHPWDLWTVDQQPKPGTDEIVGVLERVLQLKPDHAGACHLYIHALESGPHPERALPAAQRLSTLVAGAGHLVHMPAHIDARLGLWADACEANRRAIAADAKHAARFPPAGFYHVYMAHNHHFLAWASMMQGDKAEALEAARAMVAGIPKEFFAAMAPLIDGYVPVVLHVEVRFGAWAEILAAPKFPDELKISNAVRHYARGVALTALDRLDEAAGELRDFDAVVATIEETRPIGNNPARTVLQIPRALLVGELGFRRGEIEAGLASLREAVRVQASLVYDEAPDWMMPSRHALGAALLEAKQFAEAEAVFRADLVQYPKNGWSLFGLERALRGRGADAEAKQVAEEFTHAWSNADVTLSSPCFCQAGR